MNTILGEATAQSRCQTLRSELKHLECWNVEVKVARAPVPLNSGLISAAVYSSVAWTGLHGCTPRHSP